LIQIAVVTAVAYRNIVCL